MRDVIKKVHLESVPANKMFIYACNHSHVNHIHFSFTTIRLKSNELTLI